MPSFSPKSPQQVDPEKNYVVIRSNSEPPPNAPTTLPAAQLTTLEDFYKTTPAAGLEKPDFVYPNAGGEAEIVGDPDTKISFSNGVLEIKEGELVQCLRKWCQEGDKDTYSATIVFTNNPGALINARC
jgi:hypothetical protein